MSGSANPAIRGIPNQQIKSTLQKEILINSKVATQQYLKEKDKITKIWVSRNKTTEKVRSDGCRWQRMEVHGSSLAAVNGTVASDGKTRDG